MKDYILPVILAIVGSGTFFSFLQFLITRHDSKKGAVAINLTRLQLMLLIADYPKKTDEIFDVAKYYFCVLDGDTYITGLFIDWLHNEDLKAPDWFVEHLNKKGELKWLDT